MQSDGPVTVTGTANGAKVGAMASDFWLDDEDEGVESAGIRRQSIGFPPDLDAQIKLALEIKLQQRERKLKLRGVESKRKPNPERLFGATVRGLTLQGLQAYWSELEISEREVLESLKDSSRRTALIDRIVERVAKAERAERTKKK